ncbi:MAG: ceramidase domain-containing protein [Gemmatimonadaceae bacterium]
MPDACFCEATRTSGPHQPANTWSSLAFVVVAVMILARVARDRSRRTPVAQNRTSTQLVYPLVYVLALLVTGLGSAWFHATLSFAGQFADVMGMYLIATFILLYSLGRISTMRPVTMAASYVTANAALAAVLYWLPDFRRYIFGLLIVAALGLERVAHARAVKARANNTHLLLAVGILALGFVIWILDITRTLCSPGSWLQGHALWHLLGAVASWQLYMYYRRSDSNRGSVR